MSRVRIAPCAALVLILATTSCAEDEPANPAVRKGSSAPAASGAMCAEHGVLEAVCTKCNPKLAAVFQAKGDWCPEHGFPESFCPICHPERGGMPGADVKDEVKDDGAPADGTKVRFKSKDAARMAGIEAVPAEARSGGARLEAVATIVYDATRHAEVNARAAGVVRRINVDVGARVVEGAQLALIESASVGADRARVRAAASRLEVAEATHERTKSLHESGVAPEKDIQTARQDLDAARGELAAARASLGMVGTGQAGTSAYAVRAPLAGTVIRRVATIGHMVDGSEVLFEIVDTSSMWVEIDVPEDQAGAIATGQPLTVVLDAAPGREWKGHIEYVAPEVDVRTRTARARARLDNPDGVLRANLYGHALVELGAARPTVMVPKEAVQRAGGVKSGEPVATRGSFLLKTETLKGAIGAGCCDVE